MDNSIGIPAKLARGVTFAAFTGLLALGLAACGGNDAPPTSAPAAIATTLPAATAPAASDAGAGTSSGTEQAATASLKEWAVALSPTDISAGKVKYTVTNDGQFTHDLVVLDSAGNEVGATTKFAAAQNPQTLEVDLKPGTYTFMCDIPGHAAKGMKTEVTVK